MAPTQAERRWQAGVRICIGLDVGLLILCGWLLLQPREGPLVYVQTAVSIAGLASGAIVWLMGHLETGGAGRSAVLALTAVLLAASLVLWSWRTARAGMPTPMPPSDVYHTPTARPTHIRTPTVAPTATLDCSTVTLPACLELDLATGPSQEKCASADGVIVLSPADVAGLANLSDRAVVTAPDGCVCAWQGRAKAEPSLQPLPGRRPTAASPCASTTRPTSTCCSPWAARRASTAYALSHKKEASMRSSPKRAPVWRAVRLAAVAIAAPGCGSGELPVG